MAVRNAIESPLRSQFDAAASDVRISSAVCSKAGHLTNGATTVYAAIEAMALVLS